MAAETCRAVTVEMGEPVTLALSPPEEKRWGWFQFPTLSRLADGAIRAGFHMQPDSYEVYTAPDGARDPKYAELPDSYFSTDNGETWAPYGDRDAAAREHDARLAFPDEIRYPVKTANGTVVPYFLEGHVHVAPNGRDLVAIWDGHYARPDGSINERWNCLAYLSHDLGRTWELRGIIDFEPDMRIDALGDLRIGFTEPDFVFLDDETLYAVMRTTDGHECKAIKVCEIRVTPTPEAPAATPDQAAGAEQGSVTWERHYSDREGGTLEREIPFVDGHVHGVVKTYFRNGRVASETPFVNGVTEGPQRIFFPSGQLRRETTWYREHIHGPQTEYDEDGSIVSRQYYRWWVPCSKAEFEADAETDGDSRKGVAVYD